MDKFKNILCVVEPVANSLPVVERAVAFAENNQVGLTVMSVIERIAPMIEASDDALDLKTEYIAHFEQQLQALVSPYRKRVIMEVKVLQGTLFLQVIREVLRNGHDLVIKAPEDPDWLDRLFGSNDMHLLRKCPCPVWMLKPDAAKKYRRVLAAVDISEESTPASAKKVQALNLRILENACVLAMSEFAEMHIVHVWDALGEGSYRGSFLKIPEEKLHDYIEREKRKRAAVMEKLLQSVRTSLGNDTIDYLQPKPHLINGYARKEIPQLAREIDADLVVMGTVARTGISGLIMGNTAESILEQLNCSVFAIKPSGFVTPVTADKVK